jgi:hypothetical protein
VSHSEASGPAIVTQVCQPATTGSLLKNINITYLVDPRKQLLGIYEVHASGAKEILSGNTWRKTNDPTQLDKIIKFQHQKDFGSTEIYIETTTGDLSLRLQDDDDGVAMLVYINADGPRQATFYRCDKYPFN